jgi:L-threonylcarbamoyladenylate synthase
MGDQRAAARDALREGALVALPTDTVYGLCVLAGDDAAVERLYRVKGREATHALPLFVGSLEQARQIGEMNEAAEALATRFWPGALTLVVRMQPEFVTRAAASGETVGLRVPDSALLRELALELGPITGTSANLSGSEECRSGEDVRAQLGDAVDLIVDSAVATESAPSTVVDCTHAGSVRVLRDGAIDRAALAAALTGIASVVGIER